MTPGLVVLVLVAAVAAALSRLVKHTADGGTHMPRAGAVGGGAGAVGRAAALAEAGLHLLYALLEGFELGCSAA